MSEVGLDTDDGTPTMCRSREYTLGGRVGSTVGTLAATSVFVLQRLATRRPTRR